MSTRSKPFHLCCRTLLPLLPALAGCSSDFGFLNDGASFDNSGIAGSNTGGASGSGGDNSSGAVPETGGTGGSVENPATEMGGEASAGGADTEPAPVCEPSGAELCNDRDDDCNGVIDDGCPGGISTTFQRDLQALGDSPGGAAFTDGCKDGEVLSGVEVAVGAFLSQVRGACRTLSLARTENAPSGYCIKLTDSTSLDPHPATSSDQHLTLSCPENEALVGLRVSQQWVTLLDGQVVPVIPRVWLSCAKLVLLKQDAGYEVSWEGKKELAPASGSVANGTAWFASAEAPKGLVGSRLIGASGVWVDRLGFGVSRLEVVLR